MIGLAAQFIIFWLKKYITPKYVLDWYNDINKSSHACLFLPFESYKLFKLLIIFVLIIWLLSLKLEFSIVLKIMIIYKIIIYIYFMNNKIKFSI